MLVIKMNENKVCNNTSGCNTPITHISLWALIKADKTGIIMGNNYSFPYGNTDPQWLALEL